VIDVFSSELTLAVHCESGQVLGDRILWCGTSETRRRGLLGRTHLGPGEGAFIVPTQWIHMFGMKIPLDIAFLDAEGTVLHAHHSLRPNRVSRLVWRANGALELPVGTLESAGVARGDTIEFHPAGDPSR
jgi:uncharacterized membrane protein (UPF0127 family)